MNSSLAIGLAVAGFYGVLYVAVLTWPEDEV
jgi:hypothetical protein